MKIEVITLSFEKKMITHITSTDRIEIKFKSKKLEECFSETLAYMEEYTLKNGFKFLTVNGRSFYIVKE